MSNLTTRLSLVEPVGTDAASALRTSITSSMTTLDNAAIFLSGTLVSRPAASIAGRYYLATDDTSSGASIGTLYFDTGSAWVSGFNPPSRGAVSIATAQSTSSTTYTTLASPDQVTGIVMPTNGLLGVWYEATWQESVSGAAAAAIFLGATQIHTTGASSNVAGGSTGIGGTAATNVPLSTQPNGLQSNLAGSGYPGDVSTGQYVGSGPAYVFAAAGTYTVSVQFKASSGSVTAQNRRLWVSAMSFA